jgi:hypothetical protein
MPPATVVWEYVAHRVGGSPRRRIVVVSVALESEGGCAVSDERLEIPDWLAAPYLWRQGVLQQACAQWWSNNFGDSK